MFIESFAGFFHLKPLHYGAGVLGEAVDVAHQGFVGIGRAEGIQAKVRGVVECLSAGSTVVIVFATPFLLMLLDRIILKAEKKFLFSARPPSP